MAPYDLYTLEKFIKKRGRSCTASTEFQKDTVAMSFLYNQAFTHSLEANYPQHKEIPHYHLSLYSITFGPFKPMYFTCSDSLDGCSLGLPGGNEVLGQVDADRCSCDSDMSVTCPVQLAADLDLSSRHLPDLVDLSPLTADDRADQLQRSRGETDQSLWWKSI